MHYSASSTRHDAICASPANTADALLKVWRSSTRNVHKARIAGLVVVTSHVVSGWAEHLFYRAVPFSVTTYLFIKLLADLF